MFVGEGGAMRTSSCVHQLVVEKKGKEEGESSDAFIRAENENCSAALAVLSKLLLVTVASSEW